MNREEMLSIMPHRGRNVLVDEFELLEPGAGRATLTIAPGDPQGRDMFLVRDGDRLLYCAPFLVEHVALNSILILRDDMGDGRLAYFSAVTKFEAHEVAEAGTPLVSNVIRTKDRRDFKAFRAEVETADGRPVLSANFMAFLAERGAALDTATQAKPPEGFCCADAERLPCFDPCLAFCGDTDAEGRCGGVYPEDHPLCEGHFPGAPVMMGMTQWLAVAQRGALDAPAGESEILGDGALTLADGTPVLDVSGLRAAVHKDVDGNVASLRILATRKVAFRGMVFPGDAFTATFRSA
ncbi:MAG: hypothetical protein ABFS86_05685 [Planctomycetota bacterium]